MPACTWPILNDELLAELLRQPLRKQACDNVGRTACGKTDNDSHGPRRTDVHECPLLSRLSG